METLAKAISSGSLRGARGNSGVILSQLLRGFTKSVKKAESLDALALAAAMERAVETAYKAVMKPKEGTILTVAKEAALKAAEIAPEAEELQPFFEEVFAHAEATLARTPEMLPVLKEAGVVDSGGQGLLEVLRGAMDGFLGKEIDYSVFEKSSAPSVTKISPQAEADIKFGYCTEFIILLDKAVSEEEEHKFKEFLTSIGDSIVPVSYTHLLCLNSRLRSRCPRQKYPCLRQKYPCRRKRNRIFPMVLPKQNRKKIRKQALLISVNQTRRSGLKTRIKYQHFRTN